MSNILKRTAQYWALKRDWLGAGAVPVSRPQAQWRADICTGRMSGEKCPMNVDAPWTEFFAEAATADLRRTIEIKNDMNLHVEGEEDLHICEGCGCLLKTKVWTPIDHIVKHTNVNDLHINCWCRSETK